MNILIIDNYDSFTYNLVHSIEKIIGESITIARNNEISVEAVEAYDIIILSPGPGLPDEAGILKAVIEKYAATKQILGVCLGHQAIGEVFGAKLQNLKNVYHGLATPMEAVSSEEPLFKNVPQPFVAGRYHSWVIDKNTLPDCLEVTATDEEGEIMAIKHKKYNVQGVQFHPESILTACGEQILANFLNGAKIRATA